MDTARQRLVTGSVGQAYINAASIGHTLSSGLYFNIGPFRFSFHLRTSQIIAVGPARPVPIRDA